MAKGGGGGGSQKSTSTMEPWKPAQAQLLQVLGQAKELYNKNGGLDAKAIQREIPSLTPDMAQSLEALAKSGQLNEVYNNMQKYTGDAGALLDKSQQIAEEYQNKNFDITGGQINDLSSQLYDSQTVQDQKKQLAQDIDQQYQDQVQTLNQQANQAGGMGNSRAGVAQGVMAGKAQQTQEKGESDIMNAARQQAQQSALATLQSNQQANINKYQSTMQFYGNMGTTLAGQYMQGEQAKAQISQNILGNQYQAAQVNQQMQAAQQETKYQNAVAQQNAGQENFNNYANVVGKLSGLGGTQSQTESGGAGGPSKAQSALGGAAAGAAAGASFGPWGAAVGGVVGGVSGLFSDATLKDNIKIKGKTKKGDAVYEWDWNEKAKKKGLKGSGSGVLAQRTDSSKVGKKQGALAVNYDATSVKAKNSK